MVNYIPQEDNRIYRYINIVVAYYRQGKFEAIKSYMKNIPEQLKDQVVAQADRIIKEEYDESTR